MRKLATVMVITAAGRCYTILGVGGQGVADLDLALFDPNGKRVASDLGFDPTPSLQRSVRPARQRQQVEERGVGDGLLPRPARPGSSSGQGRKGGGELRVGVYAKQ